MPKFLSNIQTADRIDDSTSTKKLVTQTEKNTWDAKQATLVSGTNIKTVNGSSILGSGDLVVAGGTASVTSVNTKTGAVVLTAADVGALSNTTDLSIYNQSQYNGAYNYLGGGYVSGGAEKPNNAIFGAGKLKLQMLAGSNIGPHTGWFDTLWLSSYTGGDVKGSNLLSFSKHEDRIGFSRQDFDSGAWGTYREIWHTGNFNPLNYLALNGSSSRMTGILRGQLSLGGIAVANEGNPSFEVYSEGANSAYMSFHRSGLYAVRFGLDTDNQLKIGGWSMGAVAYRIWHEGNFATHSAGNGFATSSGAFNGSTARTWTIGGGTGITINADDVALTSITSGVNTVGALRYNGTSRLNATLYGGSTVPSGTTNLNYDGIFWAQGLRFGASGSSSYSDRRMKKDVGSLNYAEQLILKLKPKQFRFKAEFEPPEEVVPSKANAEIPTSRTTNREKLQFGFIAQDVEKILEDIGIKRASLIKEPNQEDKYYGLDYIQLIAPMVDVIQKQQKRIDDIERLLERLA